MSGPGRPFEIIPASLKRAFEAGRASGTDASGTAATEYRYDESQFAVCTETWLEVNLDPITLVSPNGTHVGAADFLEVRADPEIPFALDETGRKVPVDFFVHYDQLPERIENLKRLGIRPSQSEKGLREIDAKLAEFRREAGPIGRLLRFPGSGR